MKHTCNTLTVSCEKSKIVSLAWSKRKNTSVLSVLSARSRFPVTLIYWFAVGSAWSSCFLLKCIAINL